MSKIVEGLKYSESHEWVKVEDGVALVGVSDFAQKEMGDITYVDMPDVDDEVTAGEPHQPGVRQGGRRKRRTR